MLTNCEEINSYAIDREANQNPKDLRSTATSSMNSEHRPTRYRCWSTHLRVTQQLLCSKSHDFLAVCALAHSKINQIAKFFDDDVRNHLNFLFKH